jgi:hypothetical protein
MQALEIRIKLFDDKNRKQNLVSLFLKVYCTVYIYPIRSTVLRHILHCILYVRLQYVPILCTLVFTLYMSQDS